MFKTFGGGSPQQAAPKRILFLGLLAAGILLLMPWPLAHSLGSEALENAAHAPLFAVLAALALRARRTVRGRRALRVRDYLAVWGLMTLLGALTEVAQAFVGRDASLVDLANDALGAALGLVITSWLRPEPFVTANPGRWIAPVLIAVGTLLYAAPPLWSAAAYAHRWMQRPVLWQWHTPLDDYFVSHVDSQVHRIPASSCLTDTAAQLRGQALWIALDAGTYPGVTLDEPYPDWRGYRTLAIDVANPGAEPVPLSVRVDDALHNHRYDDRYTGTFELPAQQRTRLRIPLLKIERTPSGRKLDLARVATLIIFRAGSATGAAMCLFSIELER